MLTVATAPLKAEMSPQAVRLAIRAGEIDEPTSGYATAHVQANLVALPRAGADDFLLFCQRNPKPCPLLDVIAPGSYEPVKVAPGADLRTDIPRYRVYRDGAVVAEPADVTDAWRDDLVSFLLGCSYTFEGPLLAAGVPVRHLTGGRNVPMYRTNQQCTPAGAFHGPLVVSFRSIPAARVETAIAVTGRLPAVHGAPVHVGDPAAIGITDLGQPEWGDPPLIEPGDVPVFWACGVTPQAVAMASKPDFMITHAPGHMLVTDLTVASLVTSREP
ncbi:MAG: putative hydro-lyase [Chloroflexia bacterium]|nr:putative hydro-lyase [Chloroflexia bacterium]MDQ3413279.1 putative hydro-lyase [Chloroflexota bacterium]